VTMLAPQPQGIPAPVPGLASLPYWEGCRIGELRVQRCDACAAVQSKPTTICQRCHRGALSWHRARGTGTLYSWTVVWRPQHPTFQVPYAPAVVALDEGLHLMTAIIGCRTADLTAGLAVVVEFHPVSDSITLPYFRPRGSEGE